VKWEAIFIYREAGKRYNELHLGSKLFNEESRILFTLKCSKFFFGVTETIFIQQIFPTIENERCM